MKNIVLYITFLSSVLISCDNFNSDLKISIKNNTEINLIDYPVYLEYKKLNRIKILFPDDNICVLSDNIAVPSQTIIRKNKKNLLVLVDLKPYETKSLKLKKGTCANTEWNKRTHAELSHKINGKFVDGKYQGGETYVSVDSIRVPDEVTDQSFYFKFEGPGWESDKVAYRFYLDWRNAVDVFGKISKDMVLPQVGLNDDDSYHILSNWGMDILKVGNSLGIGSIATWTGKKAERVSQTDSIICTIENDGDLFSEIRTRYYNWQNVNGNVNLDSRLFITAGSRITKNEISIEGTINNIATGIVKQNLPIIKGTADTEWGYIATWGKQSLNNDNLGLVIFFKNKHAIEITEDEYNYVVVLEPEKDNEVKYYFAAVWEKENGKIITKEDFINYINNSLDFLNKPVDIIW